jgi:hypothetical protein
LECIGFKFSSIKEKGSGRQQKAVQIKKKKKKKKKNFKGKNIMGGKKEI